MDDIRIAVALGPLALYLFALGVVNLRRRPTLVTGARDTAALGLGVSGMLLVGPIELLHPQAAVNQLGPYVWVMSVGMYLLGLSLVVLLAKPRLTIYNMSPDEFRATFADVLGDLDTEHRWAGTTLALPQLHVQLNVETNVLMRNVSLVSVGDEQSFVGWQLLRRALHTRLRATAVEPGVWGISLGLAAFLLIVATGWELNANRQEILAALRDILQN